MKDWTMLQFGFIIGLCQTNTFLAYKYFKNNKLSENEMLIKAQFTRMLADELIANTMWSSEKKKAVAEEVASRNTKPWKRVEEHELLKISP